MGENIEFRIKKPLNARIVHSKFLIPPASSNYKDEPYLIVEQCYQLSESEKNRTH